MVNWDKKLYANWSYEVEGRTLEKQHRLEDRPLASLRAHEKPSAHKVSKIVAAMKAGDPIAIPLIGEDGMIIDGHHRIEAAIRFLGDDAVIPTQVHRIVDVTKDMVTEVADQSAKRDESPSFDM